MSSDENRHDELLRRFEEVIAGRELDDLRQLASDLMLLRPGATGKGSPGPRPELRRPALDELRIFRVRVDLDGSRPRIWRRLELRSDLTLDVVHQALQTAFDWTDTHLWRFSLGGDPFVRSAQAFLCAWDVEEGELEDEGCPPASEVRLDETVQAEGDVLHYVYDYGDGWKLTLRVEAVSAAAREAPAAVALAGRRAAPPEDCGGITDGAELAEILEDPERFDIDEVNALLRRPFFELAAGGLDRRLVDLVGRLAFSSLGEELGRRVMALSPGAEAPERSALEVAFRGFSWFLDRAAEKEIPLTAAGYLRPADVQAAAVAVPAMDGWIGKANRESETAPVLHFRKLLQSLGLLQKRKGALRLTRAGAAAQRSHEELWNRLADKLALSGATGFDADATLLVLVYAASCAESELPLAEVAAALNELGWRVDGERPIERWHLYRLDAVEVIRNLVPPDSDARWWVSPVAAGLARAALQRR